MSLKRQILSGSFWALLGHLGYLLIGLISNIWLARLLSPSEFGQVGIILFFIAIANILAESGLGGALIRKKEATAKDYSTVFIVNLIVSIFCVFLLIFFSNTIAFYYNDKSLGPLLAVASFVLIINAFQITQNANLVSKMQFKKRSIYRFAAITISSLVAIIMAYSGFGVWSLIILQLLNGLLFTLFLWFTSGFYFQIHFSKQSFKELYSFGVNTTLASVINTAFENVYQLILAKYFSVAETGFFYQARKLQDVPGGLINMLSQSVIFSGLTKLQHDKKEFTKAYLKIALYFLCVFGLISIILYLYSYTLILWLFGEKWLGAVFYMQLLTIASFFYMQEKINRIIYKVFNKTHQLLYLEICKKVVQTGTIVIGVWQHSLEILIYGFIFTSAIGYFMNYFYSRKILGSLDLSEFMYLVKVCFISLFVIVSNSYLFSGNLATSEGILFLPISVGLYIILLSAFKVINFKKEYYFFKNII